MPAPAGSCRPQVAAVISNKREAYGLERARQAGVPALVFAKAQGAGARRV